MIHNNFDGQSFDHITHSQEEISQTQLAKMWETMTENYTFQRKRKQEPVSSRGEILSKLNEAKSTVVYKLPVSISQMTMEFLLFT